MASRRPRCSLVDETITITSSITPSTCLGPLLWLLDLWLGVRRMKQEDQKIGQSESCSDKGGPPTDDDSFRPCTIRFGATGERSNARIPNRSAVKPAAAGGGDQIGQALRGDVMSIIVQGCYYTVYPPAPQLGELHHPGVPMARSRKPCYQSPGRHSPRCRGRLPRHERGLIKAGRPLNLAAARCDQRDSSANPR